MLARVMTFYTETDRMVDLVASLRKDLTTRYEALPGFRGLLVLERPGNRNHVIALTLWEDEKGVEESELIADRFADRITHAIGTSVSRAVYEVVVRLGVADATPPIDTSPIDTSPIDTSPIE